MGSNMNVRYLKSRGDNRSSNVARFMKLWDTPLTAAQQDEFRRLAPASQKLSATGNLNNDGTPYPSTSCLVSRFHPDFESVLEPGVKEFLAAIAIDLNLVTYTSCEGHFYPDGTHPHDERHVGVIPRSDGERQRILQLFETVAQEINGRFPEAPIEVAIMDHSVRDGDTVYSALDLYLSKREGAGWDQYFAQQIGRAHV